MAQYNIEMNSFDGSQYNQLYPRTLLNNVTDWNGSIYSKSEIDSELNSVSTNFNSKISTITGQISSLNRTVTSLSNTVSTFSAGFKVLGNIAIHNNVSNSFNFPKSIGSYSVLLFMTNSDSSGNLYVNNNDELEAEVRKNNHPLGSSGFISFYAKESGQLVFIGLNSDLATCEYLTVNIQPEATSINFRYSGDSINITVYGF